MDARVSVSARVLDSNTQVLDESAYVLDASDHIILFEGVCEGVRACVCVCVCFTCIDLVFVGAGTLTTIDCIHL